MFANLSSRGREGRSQKKGYIGPVSTKTHSGDPDGTGGFGGFLGSGRFLALKFGFYKKFHRQNRLEMSERHEEPPKAVFFRFWYLEGTKPRVANPRVGSGTGFVGPGGGSGGGSGGPGGGSTPAGFLFSDDFQPVLAMKFLVESEFQGQGPGKPPGSPEPPVPSGSPEWVLVLTVPI